MSRLPLDLPVSKAATALRASVMTATGVAAFAAATAVANAVTMPRLRRVGHAISERVVVCVPARNEVANIGALVEDLTRQQGVADLHVIVLDDSSTDGTAARARAAARPVGARPVRTHAVGTHAVGAIDAGLPGVRVDVVTTSVDPPSGWTGKAAACAELARIARTRDPSALVFVDADVRLAEDAVAGAVAALRRHRADLLCPWPEQIAGTPVERLVQPLLAWSWMSTLPVAVANASTARSTVVACGQFLVFDAAAYDAIGGHASVAASVTEDLDIARVLRRHGRRTAVVSGAGLIRCRMYDGPAALRDGYSRWLWSEFGGAPGSVLVSAALAAIYLLPPSAAVLCRGRNRRWGLAGYGVGVLSRVAARRRETGRFTAHDAVDSSLHPVSVAALIGLTALSHARRRRGTLRWKERPLLPGRI